MGHLDNTCTDCVERSLDELELIKGILGIDDPESRDLVYLIATSGVLAEHIDARREGRTARGFSESEFSAMTEKDLRQQLRDTNDEAHAVLDALLPNFDVEII